MDELVIEVQPTSLYFTDPNIEHCWGVLTAKNEIIEIVQIAHCFGFAWGEDVEWLYTDTFENALKLYFGEKTAMFHGASYRHANCPVNNADTWIEIVFAPVEHLPDTPCPFCDQKVEPIGVDQSIFTPQDLDTVLLRKYAQQTRWEKGAYATVDTECRTLCATTPCAPSPVLHINNC